MITAAVYVFLLKFDNSKLFTSLQKLHFKDSLGLHITT